MRYVSGNTVRAEKHNQATLENGDDESLRFHFSENVHQEKSTSEPPHFLARQYSNAEGPIYIEFSVVKQLLNF